MGSELKIQVFGVVQPLRISVLAEKELIK